MISSRRAPPFLLLQEGEDFLAFEGPRAVLEARDASSVVPVLRDADAALRAGAHVAGFLCYEAAAAFGLSTRASGGDDLPLAWLGVFGPPRRERPRLCEAASAPEVPWVAGVSAAAYARVIAALHARIAAGDTYQANFTFGLCSDSGEDPFQLWKRLLAVQRPRHAAFADIGRFAIASASPELFFSRREATITTRPMKGTAARGRTREEDERRAAALRASEKERAENLMIVDMLRNDLGRIAELGSVEVVRLFEVERYPTLLQMTSTIQARSRAPLSEVFAALFPCASVTGAPKARTMEILSGAEAGPRGVYTGTLGWAAPGGRAAWNVAIRTAVADRERGSLVFGVGSGVVADSAADAEYAECLLKCRVLVEKPFALLETMAFRPEEGYHQLAGHLARLRESAAHFGFPFDARAIEGALSALVLGERGPIRARLLLHCDGTLTTERAALPAAPRGPLRLGLAGQPVDSDSIWLHHKTTRREAYETARASRPDCDEVLLWNERGEVTETPIANVVVEEGVERVTPALRSGLLPGVERARLLAAGCVAERIVHRRELAVGARVWLVSSVRGTREAVFVG